MRRDTTAIVIFLTLALGFSGCYWVMVRLWPEGSLPHPLELLLWGIFRGFGPAVAALIAAFYLNGAVGIRKILRSIVEWRIEPRWYLLGFIWPVFAVGAGVLAAHFFAHVSLQTAADFTPRLILVFFVMAIVDGPLGEEVGWRGFLLPELLRKMHPITAGVIVGFIWWLWHIPLYLADGKSIPWALYLLNTTALSLIFTWFFVRTKGSVFFAIFLHNMSNYPIYLSRQLFPQAETAMIAKIVFLIIVIALGMAASTSLAYSSKGKLAASSSY